MAMNQDFPPCRRFYRLLLALCLALSPVLISSVQAVGEHDTMSHEHGAVVHASTEEDQAALAYSLFMHHSSGVALVALGMLVFADRFTHRRVKAFTIAIGLLWLGFGAHLFIRSDPEGWPMSAGFLESFTMPTSGEWIQHKLLSLIPLALGIWTLWFRNAKPKASVTYAVGALLTLGGAALLVHQHADHPIMDVVNLQHRLMAVTSLFIASSLVVDGRGTSKLRLVPYLVPCGLVILGLQLAFYIE